MRKALSTASILIFALLISTVGYAASDSILAAALQLEMLTAGNDILQIKDLDLRDLGINSLTGLEKYTNLEKIDLRGNPITDIKPLASLTALKSVNLRDTLVKDLKPLENLSQLTYLNLHSTPVENISPVSGLTNLNTLILANANVGKQVNMLSKLTNLTRLNLRNTGVTDLAPIAALMQQGALQDNPELAIVAEVDIRENKLPVDKGGDRYLPIRHYWSNITLREPLNLPTPMAATTIYINEIVASNSTGLKDQDGDNSDWIEIYNAGDQAYDLSGYYLTDDWDELDQWCFPDNTLVQAQGYILVFASGKTSSSQELHANFRISADGEPIILLDKEQNIVDQIAPIPIPRDISYGRIPDGGLPFKYLPYPTPLQKNISTGAY